MKKPLFSLSCLTVKSGFMNGCEFILVLSFCAKEFTIQTGNVGQ
jgi:hypothetical protein